ncbi:hypothetical protein RclHR1_09150002 [Rhizophagus clarus]|uniref:Integrase catalytic domain-containing protein n=1 Tax=Rhizophagus clarus TaxID=94130 RepID=A0A2Z6S5N8_9GLOM|nr:hypothetical protein RclHR1_09150002 [Rhizophagus clarus]
MPNECHQADILYMPHDKIGYVTYLFCLNVVDVASRYKASVPIGATSIKNRESILTLRTIAKTFEQIYDDPDCPLVWPKLLVTDKGFEFKSDCERVMRRHNVKIQKAMSKHSVGIVKRYNLTLVKRLFCIQNAHELSFHTLGKSLIWPGDNVRYLLEPGKLKDGLGRRVTDMNWSPKVYNIGEACIQKNQPVLYKLLDRPECRFVREELLLISERVELPPESVLYQ